MAFQDPVIDKFIREHGDHHGQRFASWIAEKMGHGTPWSTERRTRKQCPFSAHGHDFDSAFDRSSAHFAAWHSPKREPERWGEHFQLDDARIWMRLHFWAMREAGIADAHPRFAEYYCRLIGHFVSVYERLATPFARESMRWSADPANTQRYLDGGRRMPDVHVTPEVYTHTYTYTHKHTQTHIYIYMYIYYISALSALSFPLRAPVTLIPKCTHSLQAAIRALPAHERQYHGSSDRNKTWPYV